MLRAWALILLGVATLPGPAHADEGPPRVETTVLVRIHEADHEGVDGSTLRVSPRSLHVAWKAQNAHGSSWTVDGKQGKPYVSVGPLVFSDDGASHAYFAERDGQALLVVDDRELPLLGVRPVHDSLRLLPRARGAFVGETTAPGGLPSYAVWIDGVLGPSFRSVKAKTIASSPDGRRSAYVASPVEGQDVVVVDGERGNPHAGGTVGALAWSADGTRYAYVVSGAGARMWVDNAQGAPFDQVFEPRFAPRGASLLFVATRENKPVIVVDGREQPPLSDLLAPGPVWSADGAHFAYVALKGTSGPAPTPRVVVDGVDGPEFKRLGPESLLLSPDGKRHAYWAANGPKPFYVVDGVAQKEADQVGKHAAFSPDSKRFAYSVQRAGTWFVVTDGVEGPPVEGVMVGFPVFTSDGARVLYQAALAGKVHVFVDGKPGPAFDGFAQDGFALGQGSSAAAVIARRGNGWRIVVDGVESTEEFMAVLPGSALVADGPRSFRAWVARGADLLHLRATLTPGGAPR